MEPPRLAGRLIDVEPFRYATAALGCAALAVLAVLAGCSSARPSAATAAIPAAGTAGAAVSAAGYGCPAPSPGKTPASRRLAARLQARVLLCDFAVPPGARRLGKAPPVHGGAVAGHARGVPAGYPDFLRTDEWWLLPGKPAAVLAWEARHVHGGLKGTGPEESGQPRGPYQWLDVFSPAAAPAWIAEQGLSLTATAHGKGTALHAGALVAWFPARSASEKVPATAGAVTVSVSYARESKRKPQGPVTVTAPATVRKLVALVNGLRVLPSGLRGCWGMPDSGIVSLTLKFRTAPGGPPLAVATDMASGCGWVSLTIGGKSQPGLEGVRADQVLKIAGLDGKIR